MTPAFEQFARSKGWPTWRKPDGKTYIDTRVQFAAEAWQAREVPAGWVSVTDRLPASYADSWLHLSTGAVVAGSYFASLGSWDWESEDDADNEASVLHWQPLTPPAAPQQPTGEPNEVPA